MPPAVHSFPRPLAHNWTSGASGRWCGPISGSLRVVSEVGFRGGVHSSRVLTMAPGHEVRSVRPGAHVLSSPVGAKFVPGAVSGEAAVVAGQEEELVAPSEEFQATALVASRAQYDEMYKRSVENPDGFWGDIASTFFWKKRWPVKDGKVHTENIDVRNGRVAVEWFKGGQTNICYNAIDRHVEAGLGDKVAFYWEGNDLGVDASLTYKEVLEKVCQLANYLRSQGVKKGDAVAIYMPMLAELPIAMLACARIGAVHSVVFAGFSAESLYQRILDCKPNVILTSSAVKRGAKIIKLKDIVDDALSRASADGHTVGMCLTYDNSSALKREETAWTEGRDSWWQDIVPSYAKECDVEWVDAEDTLFLLYTSGSTGKPKGVLHTTGGYMVYAATTFKYAFNYHDDDVYWCTADCGWITGHSYLTYGPLLNGASMVVFEGVPNYPDAGRCWDIVDKYNVSIFYTAPTAIRSLMRSGDEVFLAVLWLLACSTDIIELIAQMRLITFNFSNFVLQMFGE
uniref:acetate--CoA ligase n=1 Tax=Physcomitrium patens TaxID=3218 RepID=A0A7I4BQZ6_PHYPA